jgi:hypothetical protein
MNKKGIVIGVIMAFTIISYHTFSTPAHLRVNTFLSDVGLVMTLGVIMGGALSGFIIEIFLRTKLMTIGRLWGGIIGSILISPMAVVAGIAFGTMSLGYGVSLDNLIGMHQVGVYVVLFVFIVLVETFVACGGAGIGAFSGSFIQYVIQHCFHHVKE